MKKYVLLLIAVCALLAAAIPSLAQIVSSEAWHGHYNITIPDASPGKSYSVYIRGVVDNATVRFVGRGITVPTLDNAGGGSWSKYAVFTFASPITENAQYEIVINGSSWKLYNSTGGLKCEGTNNQFWSYVNKTWLTDLRFFSNEGELPYWIIFPSSENSTTLTINTTAGINQVTHWIYLRDVVGSEAKLRCTIKNSSTAPATIDIYVNGHEVGSVALPATVKTYEITIPASDLISNGVNNITYVAVGTIDTAQVTWTRIIYCSNDTNIDIWVNATIGSKYIAAAYGNYLAIQSSYNNATKTFEFFENFESASISGWSGTLLASITSNAYDGSYSLQVTDDSSTTGYILDRNVTSMTTFHYIVHACVLRGGNFRIGTALLNSSGNELFEVGFGYGGFYKLYYKAGPTWFSTGIGYSSGVWYTIDIWGNSHFWNFRVIRPDGSILVEKTDLIYSSTFDHVNGVRILTGANEVGTADWDMMYIYSIADPATVTGFFVSLTGNPSISVNGKTATYYGGLSNDEVSPPVNLNSSWFINGTNTITFNSAIGSADILINASYLDNVSINVTTSLGLIEQSAAYSPATNATGEAWFNVSFGCVNMTVYSLDVKLNGSNYTDYEFSCPNLSIHIPSVTAGATYSFYMKVLYNNPPHVNISIPDAYTTMNNSSIIYHCLVGEPVHFNLIYSDPENNSLYSVLWNFGDGVTSTVENPVHTYTHMGYYRVSVSATDSGYVKHLTGTKNITILITGNRVSHSHIHTIVITNNYISIDGHRTYMLGGRAVIGSNYIQIGNTVIPVCINNLTAESAHALAKVMNYMPINESISFIKTIENNSIWDAMNVTYSPYLNSTIRNEIIQELDI